MAIVRNIQNNDFYLYLGENNFRNMRTGKEGVVDDEKARQLFKINIEMTLMVEENPSICELVKKCNLRFDNNK